MVIVSDKRIEDSYRMPAPVTVRCLNARFFPESHSAALAEHVRGEAGARTGLPCDLELAEQSQSPSPSAYQHRSVRAGLEMEAERGRGRLCGLLCLVIRSRLWRTVTAGADEGSAAKDR